MESVTFKECPFCKEQIRKEAVKCRFCGEWLEERHQPKADSVSEQERKLQPNVSNPKPEAINRSVAGDTAACTTEAAISESLPRQARTTPIRRDRINLHSNPLTPVLLMILWIFCYVMPLAIRNGASGFVGILLGTLSFCTTPGSLLVLPILAFWFWRSRLKVRLAAQTAGETFKHSPREVWPIIAVSLSVVALAYLSIRPAFEARAAAVRQRLMASGVNPDALKGWEVLKRDQKLGDAATGLTPAAKKRMREIVALQLRGGLAAFTNLSVDLQGADHDRLAVACSNMNPISRNLREVLEQADKDFWNRMRLFDFNALVITGTNYSETILKSKFAEWSRGYEAYVSNTLAMYQEQLFDAGGNELSPAMQKTMRQNFASELDGALKSIYKSLAVRLEGENEDKMVIHRREMNAHLAEDLLRTLREDKTGNIWNALRALGCNELILSGDNYRRSIPRSEFIQWCRDYEKYVSELRRVAGQISGGLKHEVKAP